MSRDTFYRYRSAVEDGGVEAQFERTRCKPILANRADEATEMAVIISATDFPGYGRAVNRHPTSTPYRRAILPPLVPSWPGAAGVLSSRIPQKAL